MNRNLRFGAKTVRSTPGSVHPAQNLTGNRLGRVPGPENHGKSMKIINIRKIWKIRKNSNSRYSFLIAMFLIAMVGGVGLFVFTIFEKTKK